MQTFLPYPDFEESLMCLDPKRLGNHWVYDKYLNPIRDQPGEDEMLRIAGKPKEIENV